MFSLIKKFRTRSDFVLPDRAQVTMTVPFMRAYTNLLVKTCHRRGAHALGGMAAFIPNRRDPAVTEVALARVRDDKLRESREGFDGTWVAHPDLVTVARERPLSGSGAFGGRVVTWAGAGTGRCARGGDVAWSAPGRARLLVRGLLMTPVLAWAARSDPLWIPGLYDGGTPRTSS